MRGARARRGMILAIAGVLILVIAIGTTMLQQVSRQRYREAHLASRAEVALNLAESGRNLVLEELRETGLVPGSRLHGPLVARLVEEGGRTEVTLPLPDLEELAASLDPDTEVEVTLTLRDEGPLLPGSGLRGLARDPREKEATMVVRSSATFQGVTRTLIAASRVRIVRVTAPVLSKFTLWVASREGQEPNLLEVPQGGTGEARLGGRPAAPLILHHRRERFPAVVDGRFDPLAPLFTEMPLDREGLVHLGGDEPWVLNLAHGPRSGRVAELFHLRRTRYAYPSAVPGVSRETGVYFGFHAGVLAGAPFPSAPRRPAELGGGEVPDRAAALHLFGDVEDVSPTIVLGPVYRSYLRLITLDGRWYPYRADGGGPPAGFPGSAEDHGRVMARVMVDPYNRSVDFIATNREVLLDGARVGAAGTPFAPAPRLVPEALSRVGPADGGDRAFLYPEPGAGEPGAVRLARVMDDGAEEELFRGRLDDLDGAVLEDALRRKATDAVSGAAELLQRFAEGGVLDTEGVVLVRSGEVALGGLRVGRPSMVLVEGSVVITGPLTQEDGAPLTVVALRGDVRVETGARVEAALVALRGTGWLRGAVDLLGGVAARAVDLRTLAEGAGPKHLRYDEGLDPTHEASYWRHFRIWTSPVVRMGVEGG